MSCREGITLGISEFSIKGEMRTFVSFYCRSGWKSCASVIHWPVLLFEVLFPYA